MTPLITNCGGGGGGGGSASPAAASSTASSTATADTTPPEMTLSGPDQLTMTAGTSYDEQGASATDDVDGSLVVVISGSVGSTAGQYTITYTASDAAGNSSTATRLVTVEAAEAPEAEILTVFDDGLPGESWDLGLNAFDEATGFALCSNDNGDGCPNISWEIVNDAERGAVVEIRHSPSGMNTGFFLKTSNPLDLSDFAGGTIEFDVKVISGDSALSMKIDCVYPCTSGDYDLEPVSPAAWAPKSVQINDLVAQDLDLSSIDTGIVIWATQHTDTVFRLDNVRWIGSTEVQDQNDNGASGSDEPWTNPNLSGSTSPEAYDGYTLLWADEFEGSDLNLQNWQHEIGTGDNGWGNNELQYYRAENTTVQDGLLIIAAKEEDFAEQAYTSSRLTTEGKFSFQYGRVDIRAALPRGQGLWPALWMLGDNFATEGWPDSGEIDIMEMIGGSGRENTVYGTTHWKHNNTHAEFGGSYQLSDGDTLASAFHVFSIIWTEDSLTWYIDDIKYHEMAFDGSEGQAAFHKAFFLIVNVAVGGNWPGNPNSNTQFPQYMLVDYIRVFERD